MPDSDTVSLLLIYWSMKLDLDFLSDGSSSNKDNVGGPSRSDLLVIIVFIIFSTECLSVLKNATLSHIGGS